MKIFLNRHLILIPHLHHRLISSPSPTLASSMNWTSMLWIHCPRQTSLKPLASATSNLRDVINRSNPLVSSWETVFTLACLLLISAGGVVFDWIIWEQVKILSVQPTSSVVISVQHISSITMKEDGTSESGLEVRHSHLNDKFTSLSSWIPRVWITWGILKRRIWFYNQFVRKTKSFFCTSKMHMKLHQENKITTNKQRILRIDVFWVICNYSKYTKKFTLVSDVTYCTKWAIYKHRIWCLIELVDILRSSKCSGVNLRERMR